MEIQLNKTKLRINNYRQNTFIDIDEPEGQEHYAHRINFYPSIHFVALVNIKGYTCPSIVIFENKNSYEEWYKNNEVKLVKVLTKDFCKAIDN